MLNSWRQRPARPLLVATLDLKAPYVYIRISVTSYEACVLWRPCLSRSISRTRPSSFDCLFALSSGTCSDFDGTCQDDRPIDAPADQQCEECDFSECCLPPTCAVGDGSENKSLKLDSTVGCCGVPTSNIGSGRARGQGWLRCGTFTDGCDTCLSFRPPLPRIASERRLVSQHGQLFLRSSFRRCLFTQYKRSSLATTPNTSPG